MLQCRDNTYSADLPSSFLNHQDSHDAVVLDFWVEALTSGTIKLDAWFASNECQPEAEYPGRKPQNDVFHFEVTGCRGSGVHLRCSCCSALQLQRSCVCAACTYVCWR